jgi:hypothetical protein
VKQIKCFKIIFSYDDNNSMPFFLLLLAFVHCLIITDLMKRTGLSCFQVGNTLLRGLIIAEYFFVCVTGV